MALALGMAAVSELERVLPRDREHMALADAMARRLGVESWMLTFGDDGRLRAVTLFAAALPSRGPEIATTVPVTERPLALRDGGALARLVAAPTATVRQLADIALRQPDPEVRAEAVRILVDAAARDPELERTLLAAVDQFDDATLARALSGVAGDGAAGLVALVADAAHGRPLGARAAAVLRHLSSAR